MKTIAVTSLREVLKVAFAEFSKYDETQPPELFYRGEGVYRTKISKAKQDGPNGPFTLVLRERIHQHGRWYLLGLMVFDYPVKHDALNPGEIYYPVLALEFFTDDPPYEPCHVDGRWEKGKGFWVSEYMASRYGDRNSRTHITSNYDDWEFEFLLRIQSRVHELAKGVTSRGHWQCEWNPEGDFSKKPVLKN